MRISRRQIFLPASAIVGAMLATAPDSTATQLSPAKQALFLARTIAYDGNLKDRAGVAVNIAVLVAKGDKESERMSEEVLLAFKPLEAVTLAGLPVRVERVFFSGEDALQQSIRDAGVDTMYVCSGLDGSVAAIKRVVRKLKVLTVASQENYVRLGLSLGFFELDGKNSIAINLDASREEGVAFGPELLRLATIIR